ncbi:S8 family serine peptidase [Weeksellaceae bacterium KMM 9724]|uniref:S8 family peptidase n=1 Tax=Profundicola chukchiensis TaxID=2961959 RepID=UPI002438E4A3|nr:S8 family serine peptidase [Profundicola chukchiensis]MDG4950761.1 S8 family serine peptidase [Profundicola chukchiensis]
MRKFPLTYYFILGLIFLLAIALWVFMFWNSNHGANQQYDYDQNNPISRIGNNPIIPIGGGNNTGNNTGNIPPNLIGYRPIQNPNLIDDDESKRQIVSDLVNVAIKDSVNRIEDFIQSFNSTYDTNDYVINYVDTLINYAQIKVPEAERVNFKTGIKSKLDQFSLLVWDETIFKSNATKSTLQPNWHLDKTGISRLNYVFQPDSVTIAIIDNGFDLSHPSFTRKNPKTFNATDGSSDVSPGPKNHGTHVASIALGSNINDIEGVCPSCNIMPIKVEDNNGILSSNYIIKGILYAIKNKADVINLSLGASIGTSNIPIAYQENFIGNGAKDEEAFWKELFEYAENNKTICVLAAGNDNILTGFDPFQRSKETIKVGAIDSNGQKASFSNFGKNTTIYAPGVEIFGAKPNRQFEPQSGTSMAAPIVSGFVGLLKSVDKNRDFDQINKLLIKNSEIQNGLRVLTYKTLN